MRRKILNEPIQIEDDIEFLDAKRIEITRNESEEMVVKFPDGTVHTAVVPVRAFPLTQPWQHIGLCDKDENEVGMIEDVKQLNKKHQDVLEEELEKCYFMPTITKIHSLESQFGVTQWEVETDRGPANFGLRSRYDITSLEDDRIVMKDVDGARYEIVNYHRLDPKSIALLETQI